MVMRNSEIFPASKSQLFWPDAIWLSLRDSKNNPAGTLIFCKVVCPFYRHVYQYIAIERAYLDDPSGAVLVLIRGNPL